MSRKFIVSGASRGIGLAIAQSLLNAGNQVLGVSRTASPLSDLSGFTGIQNDLTNIEKNRERHESNHETESGCLGSDQ